MEEKYNVFNLRLNVLMVGAFLTKRGMEFQMKTDDQKKARWPIVRLVQGIVKRDWSLDRSWRESLAALEFIDIACWDSV